MRLLAAMRTDAVLQGRNQLYAISAFVAVLIGAVLAWLTSPASLHGSMPMAVLFVVGGSTLLYVVAMIILERSDGTLAACVVSPLRPWEYLASKVATLTAIATLEAALICATTLWLLSRDAAVALPNIPLFLLGVVSLGAMHVLIGVVLVVRYRSIMQALLPMSGVAIVLQLPAFYYVGAFDSASLLVVPSATGAMFLRGAWQPLQAWEWAYAVGGTALTLAALSWWARRAFEEHVIRRAG